MTNTYATHVRFDTTDYVASHGCEPRGAGSWAFATVNPRRNPHYLNDVQWFHGLTYRDARARAAAWGAANGVLTLFVCA